MSTLSVSPITRVQLPVAQSPWKHCEVRGQGGGQARLGKVLLSLVHTEGCEADHLEEMFFSGMMGAVSIDTVIPYILGMRIPSIDTSLSDEDIAEEETIE